MHFMSTFLVMFWAISGIWVMTQFLKPKTAGMFLGCCAVGTLGGFVALFVYGVVFLIEVVGPWIARSLSSSLNAKLPWVSEEEYENYIRKTEYKRRYKTNSY